MLEIKIDLVPFGEDSHRREIARITIGNDGTGDYLTGNYNVAFSDGTTVRVEGHDRRDDVFTLLYLALQRKFD